MRDVRQVHEVLCPHAAVVSSSSSTNRVDGFTDVWESSLGAFAPNSLSPEAALYLSNNQTNLSKIAPGIVRFLTGSGLRLSASGIRLSEDIILTNEHVVQSMLSGGAPWMITNQPRSRFDSMRTNSKQHCLFTQLVLRPQIPLEQPMMDPIIGVGVFNYEDAATVRLNIVPGTTLANSRVIFIPSMRTVDPATNIISISYPGNEAATTNAELSFGPDLNHQQDLATYREMLPAFQDLRARFNGFGVSTVAYGKCIKPFKLHEGFWIENIAFQSTIDTDSIIVSNENSLCGGSGGAILRHDFQISSLNDTKGDVWTMVEFNGLHFGGEFIPCQECLSLDPSARVTLEPSQIQQLPHCKTCSEIKEGTRPASDRISSTYNYALSVHQIFLFKTFLIVQRPALISQFNCLPPSFASYLDVHSSKCMTMCAHCGKTVRRQVCICKKRAYCNKECQTADWFFHKKELGSLLQVEICLRF